MSKHGIVRSISGENTCRCGWATGHYALSSEADTAWILHAYGFSDRRIGDYWAMVNALEDFWEDPDEPIERREP